MTPQAPIPNLAKPQQNDPQWDPPLDDGKPMQPKPTPLPVPTPLPPQPPPFVLAPIIVQVPGDGPRTGWVFCATPEGLMDKAGLKGSRIVAFDGGLTLARRVVRCSGGVRVWMRDVSGGAYRLALRTAPSYEDLAFTFAPTVQLDRMAVWFEAGGERSTEPAYWAPDAPKPGPDFFRIVDHSAAHQAWHMRVRHPARRLTHDAWITFHHLDPTPTVVSHTVYGTTENDGQPQETDVPDLRLCSNFQMRARFAMQNGLPEWGLERRNGGWSILIAPAHRLHRGRRREARVEIFTGPGPNYDRPMMAEWTGWGTQAPWMALGKVPAKPVNFEADVAEQRRLYLHPPAGRYDDARALAQPPWAPQTGEQAGFGAAPGRLLHGEPWMIDHLLWHAQAYAQRPTANKGADGEPLRAVDHPNAELVGMRPDRDWGALDRIGWPPPGPPPPAGNGLAWINGYVTPDDEHRDDTLLCALCVLTNDPALWSILQDQTELAQLDVRLKLGWQNSPRATGRMAMAWAHAMWTDSPSLFGAARDLIRGWLQIFTIVQVVAGYPIVGGFGEAKYGWVEPNGSPVMGWQPWQQAIAAMGLWAAWRQMGAAKLKQLASIAAEAAVRGGFEGPYLYHVYAVAIDGRTKFDGAASYWTVSAAKLLLEINPQHELADKARRVVRSYGADTTPPGWMQSQWWAV